MNYKDLLHSCKIHNATSYSYICFPLEYYYTKKIFGTYITPPHTSSNLRYHLWQNTWIHRLWVVYTSMHQYNFSPYWSNTAWHVLVVQPMWTSKTFSATILTSPLQCWTGKVTLTEDVIQQNIKTKKLN